MRSETEDADGSQTWALPFAALMMLLLAIFVILFATSKADAEKLKEYARSIRSMMADTRRLPGPNQEPAHSEAAKDSGPSEMAEAESRALTEQLALELGGNMGQADWAEKIRAKKTEQGMVVGVRAENLFASGRASLNPEVQPLIKKIGKVLLSREGARIRIEGHATNEELPRSVFPSSWELSSARASAVARYLIEEFRADPTHVTVVGHGTYKNDGASQRVDILLMDPKK